MCKHWVKLKFFRDLESIHAKYVCAVVQNFKIILMGGAKLPCPQIYVTDTHAYVIKSWTRRSREKYLQFIYKYSVTSCTKNIFLKQIKTYENVTAPKFYGKDSAITKELKLKIKTSNFNRNVCCFKTILWDNGLIPC